MTEPKLCPITLRWAAQHIRGLSDPEIEWAGWEEAIDAAACLVEVEATEAELAEAKRKATALVLEPALTVDAQLAASLEAAIELRAKELRGESALTVDQDKVDERYGRIAYEAFPTMGGVPHDWENLRLESRDEFIVLAKTVCAEMAKAMKAAGRLRCVCRVDLGDSPCPVHDVRGGS
jgi:hypothetical protein